MPQKWHRKIKRIEKCMCSPHTSKSNCHFCGMGGNNVINQFCASFVAWRETTFKKSAGWIGLKSLLNSLWRKTHDILKYFLVLVSNIQDVFFLVPFPLTLIISYIIISYHLAGKSSLFMYSWPCRLWVGNARTILPIWFRPRPGAREEIRLWRVPHGREWRLAGPHPLLIDDIRSN